MLRINDWRGKEFVESKSQCLLDIVIVIFDFFSAIHAVSESKDFSILHNYLFGLSDLGVPHQDINPKLKVSLPFELGIYLLMYQF